jgi:plasmid maintenance system antidote protein VapI
MTADMALRLKKWLGVSADLWMNLQKRYELDVAAEAVGVRVQRTVHHRERIYRTTDK